MFAWICLFTSPTDNGMLTLWSISIKCNYGSHSGHFDSCQWVRVGSCRIGKWLNKIKCHPSPACTPLPSPAVPPSLDSLKFLEKPEMQPIHVTTIRQPCLSVATHTEPWSGCSPSLRHSHGCQTSALFEHSTYTSSSDSNSASCNSSAILSTSSTSSLM